MAVIKEKFKTNKEEIVKAMFMEVEEQQEVKG
jgi:hypothetical protein